LKSISLSKTSTLQAVKLKTSLYVGAALLLQGVPIWAVAQSTEAETKLFVAARAAAKKSVNSDLANADYDRNRFHLFFAPEATERIAKEDRKVAMPSSEGVAGLVISRVLSNPYIPIDSPVLVAKYYEGKTVNNVLTISLGTSDAPGFFQKISNIHCTQDDGLLIHGYAGAGKTSPNDPVVTAFAIGVWKVEQSGAIQALIVKPHVGNRSFEPCGHLAACETDHSDVWERAKSVNPNLSGAIEDKHGNVWLVHRAEPIGWAVLRFNKDGSEKIVLNRTELNQDATNQSDWMAPATLRYDAVRDEIVFMHQFWGSGEGAMGLWRINQNNQAREVLRFLTKGTLTTPSLNLMPGKFSGIERGLSVDTQGNIWFAAATMAPGYPSQAYQVIDSIKSLKKLPYVAARTDPQRRLGSDQLPPPLGGSSSPAPLGYQACFDSKGNFYFTGGTADVLRRDAKSGKVTTWVK
jgi:hypothetical protein